jgi:hypothetical protein
MQIYEQQVVRYKLVETGAEQLKAEIDIKKKDDKQTHEKFRELQTLYHQAKGHDPVEKTDDELLERCQAKVNQVFPPELFFIPPEQER